MRKGRAHRRRQQRRLRQGRTVQGDSGRPCIDKTWSDLRSWCKARGMPKTKLTLAYFPDTFRGMMATKDMGTGEDIVRVPESLLITASKVKRLLASDRTIPWTLSEHQSLTCWLYTESEKRARSEWHMYIDSLPRDFASVPLFTLSGTVPASNIAMDTREASWIMGHLPYSVQQKVGEQHERLYRDWVSTCRFLEELGLEALVAWRRYVWAWLAVNTRCIHLGQPASSKDSMALAPILDFLNHSEQADVTTFYDSKSSQFVIRTNRPFRKGQEVFISYGPHDNRFMLLEYGFVLRQNPYQVLELDHAVCAWVDAVKSRSKAAKRPGAGLMQPADIDALIATLKQHSLWGDYTISLDDLEPSYRLHAALRLLLPAEQRDVTSKQAIALWDRWRRGSAADSMADGHSADLAMQKAISAWVGAVCQGLSKLSQRMLAETALSSQPADAVDGFLVQCLHTVWLEISSIAERCLDKM
ncbi:hypothetical protein IWW45_009095 [Coemansia sp. RSA 485]|nr:hypothetical protein IWW45_009095 [Coemansia sp. RSA 485]